MANMTTKSISNKRAQHDTRPTAFAGTRGVTLAPPDYGINFVDHVSAEAGPIQLTRGRGVLPSPNSCPSIHEDQNQADNAPSAPRVTHEPVQQEVTTGVEPLLLIGPSLAAPLHSPTLPSAGQRLQLPAFLREKMESSFQQDFSRVRLHLNDAPSLIGARALTQGEEIALPARHYQPDRESGQSLIGHELVHVLQQRGGRVRRQGLSGIIHDNPRLESEADRLGAQAARGEQVPALSGVPLATQAYQGPTSALPFQPAWEYVEIGGRTRRYNLKDNQDGTYTHTSSGQLYSDTGKTDPTLGARVLTPIIPTANIAAPQPIVGPTTTHDPKNVIFKVQETGKLKYLPNTAVSRQKKAGKAYLEMKPENFALFKNSGKRGSSPKVLDPVSLKRYAYDEAGKQFYEWDAAKSDRRGTAVSTTKGLMGSPSENEQLLDRLTKGELVDRRRDDRTGKDILPFDVGPYRTSVTLPKESDATVFRTYPPLSGISAWTPNGGDVNRDHVPSGESLNQRGDPDAYNRGFTIAIPNPEMHQPFSPTFGTDNSLKNGMMDDNEGTQQRRVDFDRNHPGAAVHRDINFMLSKTEKQDYSSSHAHLDLTKSSNRLRQIGGYRGVFHRNTQTHRKFGNKRGFDPKADAFDYTVGVRKPGKNKKKISKRAGAYTYSKVKGKTQGKLLAQRFIKHLQDTGEAMII